MKINVERTTLCTAGISPVVAGIWCRGNMVSHSTYSSFLRRGSFKVWSSVHKVPALSVLVSFLGTFALDMREKREGGEREGEQSY